MTSPYPKPAYVVWPFDRVDVPPAVDVLAHGPWGGHRYCPVHVPGRVRVPDDAGAVHLPSCREQRNAPLVYASRLCVPQVTPCVVG